MCWVLDWYSLYLLLYIIYKFAISTTFSLLTKVDSKLQRGVTHSWYYNGINQVRHSSNFKEWVVTEMVCSSNNQIHYSGGLHCNLYTKSLQGSYINYVTLKSSFSRTPPPVTLNVWVFKKKFMDFHASPIPLVLHNLWTTLQMNCSWFTFTKKTKAFQWNSACGEAL